MDYEQKYKSALNWMQGLYNGLHGKTKEEAEKYFPELKESEDERIRKEIIRYFQRKVDRINAEKAIAWLEKQGDIDKVSYEVAEKEKYDFVSGHFLDCKKSFNEFKEDSSYWLEYIGNDTYIGRSDDILNEKFHITPRQLYSLFAQQHYTKEDNTNNETNAPTEYGKYVDECLNEASKHFFSDREDKYSVADLFYAGVRCGQSWLEKQGEQKPFDYENATIIQKDFAPKIEPKFKTGDWVCNGGGNPCKVNYIFCNYYELCSTEGYEYTKPIRDIDTNYHLWTIKDAKDRDILTVDGRPFIYCCNDDYKGNYCCIDSGGALRTNLDFSLNVKIILPATKEQRDLLFQKMHEAGYEWDYEKKELKQMKGDKE